jgi:hypothetical protein
MKYRGYFLVIATIFLFWQACDKIDAPYVIQTATTPVDTIVEVEKRILIEEFTGHDCPNCPGGAAAVEDIISLYGDRIIVVAVHTNWFGRPIPPEFINDYRTATGDELDARFNLESEGLPKGMVNRNGFETNTHKLGPSELVGRIEELISDQPLLDINMTINYTPGSRTAHILIDVTVLEEIQRNLLLSVFVTEDSIISPQKNNNIAYGPIPVIDEYVHRHVLRGAVNGTWGDKICDGNLNPPGTGFQRHYEYVLHEHWNDTNCALVAFVYDGDTNEVLQTFEVKIR